MSLATLHPATIASLAAAGHNIGTFIGREGTRYIGGKLASYAYNKLKNTKLPHFKMPKTLSFKRFNYNHIASRSTLNRAVLNRRAAWKRLAKRRAAGRTIFNAWHKNKYGQKRF